MNKPIELQIRNLTKNFRIGRSEVRVLDRLDADFIEGETTMIQGASGSGKSTLLQILGGLDMPQSGEVKWRDQPIYHWPGAQLARWRNRTVGFVFQAYHLLPELSAVENVDLPAMLGGRGSRREARELLDRVGLADRAEHRPAELSGGEQQRVAIARALRNDPELLLADEPTGNLDATTGGEIIDLLLRVQREQKKTLIVVTHDDSMAALGQNKLLLTQGKLTNKL
jgi:lipoprotein-releasing system ATP-binding protein